MPINWPQMVARGGHGLPVPPPALVWATVVNQRIQRSPNGATSKQHIIDQDHFLVINAKGKSVALTTG